MSKKEATIILPKFFNDGSAVPQDLIDSYIKRLCKMWGGCTIVESKGHWYSEKTDKLYTDEAYRISVAMETGQPHNTDDFIGLADKAREDFKQECIYVRTMEGYVHFI